MDWIFALSLGYLLGSVPFGLILTRLTGGGDLREVGSGNIGATNVLRTGNKAVAAATLAFDLGKGLAAVLIAGEWLPQWIALAALGAFLGHCFPVWIGFKGGKGVATTAGICFGLAWPIGVVYAVTWIAVLGVARISSLGGMSAAVAAPVAAVATGQGEYGLVLAVIAAAVLFLHRSNIARLQAGTEPKIGKGG